MQESQIRSSQCRHCAAELHSDADRLSGFCCSGCRAAFAFIHDLRLDHFYQLRGDDKLSPAQDRTLLYSYFDDPQFLEKYVRSDEQGISTIRFHIPGIHCSACIWLLEKLPEVVAGLADVRVDIVRSQIRIRYFTGQVQLSHVGQTLAALGYSPHPLALFDQQVNETAEDRLFLLQLGIAAFCAMNVMILFIGRYEGIFSGMEQEYAHLFAWVSFALSLPVVFFSALPFYQTSMAGLRMRRLHIDLPLSIAILAGFTASAVNTLLGRDEIYFDTVTALVFLLLVGRWFQRQAMKQVAQASALLDSLVPLSVSRIESSGLLEQVYVAALRSSDLILVDRNERFPCDGTITIGEGHVDNSILTGESRPVRVGAGDKVWSGTKNGSSPLQVSVEAVGQGTRLGSLLTDVQASTERSSHTSQLTDRISVYFVFGVLALAALTFLATFPLGFWEAFDRTIALLVVSCPCALGIATPVMLHLAAARAGRMGILLRDGGALERLASIRHIAFDKTGTLTAGAVAIRHCELLDESVSWSEVWQIVAGLEADTNHPVGLALRLESERQGYAPRKLFGCTLYPGKGVTGTCCATGDVFRLGALRWLGATAIRSGDMHPGIEQALNEGISVCGLERNGALTAFFTLGDPLRNEAREVITALRERNISVSIVSGDLSEVVSRTAQDLAIESSAAHGQLSPEQKVQAIERLGAGTAMAGDGINDAAALARADVGIGISGGAEACLAVSDVFLLRPDLSLIVSAVDGARRALRIIHRQLAVSLVYNICAALLAVTGHLGPLAAAVVMPLSSLTVILSSLWGAPFRQDLR